MQINLVLPWSASREENRRYKRILSLLLAFTLVLGVVIPLLTVPEISREKAAEIPPQLARIIVEQRKPPPPPPPPVVKEEPKPKLEEKKPEPKPEPKPVPKPVTPPKVAPKEVEKARERAQQSGVMAMQDTLAAMRQSFSAADVATPTNLQKPSTGATAAGARVDRAMIAGKASATSGGIATAGLSRDTGGAGTLAQRGTTQVTSSVAALAGGASAKSSGASAKSGGSPARSDETIRAVLESSKGSLYAIYNRSLRQNPTLSGKVLFELVIEASGAVSSCRIVSSELGDADLERKLVARLKMLNFGAAAVAQYKSRWEVNFLPSG